MKRIAIGLSIVVALAVASFGAGVWQVQRFMATELAVPEDGIQFEIANGSSFRAVSRQLVEKGVIQSDRWLRLHARWSGAASNVQAGDYLIMPGATPSSLLQQFTSGAVRLYSFTIIEGWNNRDLLAALHADDAVKASMTDEDWPGLRRISAQPSYTRRVCSCRRPIAFPVTRRIATYWRRPTR